MAEHYTMSQVAKVTGLPPHTLRYYEQQFPLLLDVERTKGGHRIYREEHLEALYSIITLLKEEKISIKEARRRLGEEDDADLISDEQADGSNNSLSEVSNLLVMLLKKLDKVFCGDEIHSRQAKDKASDATLELLLQQIVRCRHETKETMKLYQAIINRKNSSH